MRQEQIEVGDGPYCASDTKDTGFVQVISEFGRPVLLLSERCARYEINARSVDLRDKFHYGVVNVKSTERPLSFIMM